MNACTSLSAGVVVRDILANDAEVSRIAGGKVFPIAVYDPSTAGLPYVAYRRSGMEQAPSKAGYPGADAVRVEVCAYSAGYEEGLALAEAVRRALEAGARSAGGLTMRSCVLADSEESWEDDAFVQSMTFVIRI